MHPSKVALSRIYNFENLFSGYKVIVNYIKVPQKIGFCLGIGIIFDKNLPYFAKNRPC